MHTWLLETQIALIFFAILIPLSLAPWINSQYERFGRLAGWPAFISAATALYVCALVAFTMFPLPDETPTFCADKTRLEQWQTVPFESLNDVSAVYAQSGMAATLTSSVLWQVVFNVIFFVPLGFFLAHRWRRGIVFATVMRLAVSLAIESTQGTGIWGIYACPYRLADVDDLMTNTLGAVVGWCLGRLLTPVLPDARPEPVADLDPPGLPRRIVAVGLNLLLIALLVLGAALLIDLGRGALEGESPDAIEGQALSLALVQAAVIAALVIVVPWVRRDRATPGDACVDCLVVNHRTGQPAGRLAVAVRAVVRYGPIPLIGLIWLGLGVVDLIVGAIRTDGRTLIDLVSGTRVITLRRYHFDESASEPDEALTGER